MSGNAENTSLSPEATAEFSTALENLQKMLTELNAHAPEQEQRKYQQLLQAKDALEEMIKTSSSTPRRAMQVLSQAVVVCQAILVTLGDSTIVNQEEIKSLQAALNNIGSERDFSKLSTKALFGLAASMITTAMYFSDGMSEKFMYKLKDQLKKFQLRDSPHIIFDASPGYFEKHNPIPVVMWLLSTCMAAVFFLMATATVGRKSDSDAVLKNAKFFNDFYAQLMKAYGLKDKARTDALTELLTDTNLTIRGDLEQGQSAWHHNSYHR